MNCGKEVQGFEVLKARASMSQMLKNLLKQSIFPSVIVAVFGALIVIAVSFSLKGIVHFTLEKEAESKAEIWVQEFMAQGPKNLVLAGTADISAERIEMINTISGIGEIVRFNYFSPTGELKYFSNDVTLQVIDERTHSESAQRVYFTGQNEVSLKYGDVFSAAPHTFVEAYLPAILPSGETVGVLEVYVDVSSLAATLREIVRSLGTLVVLGSLAGFLIPSIILVFRNRKLYEAHAQANWLAAVLNDAPFEVVIKDVEGKIRAISRNVIEELKLPVKDIIGKKTADFLPDDIAEQYMSTDREVMRTGKATQMEVVETINGTTRYSLSSKFPLIDFGGRISGVCSITSDITELKESEATLAQAQKMKTIGQLSGGIAHDFNNLLSVVSGSLQLLENSSDEEERERLARVALRAIEHGSGLTKQLLALSRRSPLISKPVNLNSTLSEFEEFFLNILPAHIEFSVAPAPENPNILVDVSMLQNALLNVALNSQAAMPHGGKLIISAATTAAPIGFSSTFTIEGKCASITIADNGIGIAKDIISSVFDPFYTTREIGKGSGLGLSMVKGFIEQSNGLIQLSSNLGSGTTLTIFLPLTVETVEAKEISLQQFATVRSNKSKGRVLVVEDNEQLLKIISLKLERDGFEVIMKPSGDDALQALQSNSDIGLVLSDLVMPGSIQGIDVLRKAKSMNPVLPVILMSGYADINRSNEMELDLADKFVEKPLALKQMSEVIEELILKESY